jgi:ubiquinone/menaquinone biosynthesis C-methylase UbiE
VSNTDRAHRETQADPPAGADRPAPAPSEPPVYDLSYRDAFWASRDYEDRCDRIALRALLPAAGGQLLDLGAGFGRLADEYAAFDHVTLADASPAMIGAARERIGPDPRFTIIQADAAHLPLESGSMDVVVAIRLILHVRNPEGVFAEVARVLQPGGLFILEFPNRRHLLARLRHLARRQAWSPGDPEPHEYREGHFSHQPATVVRQLRAAGLVPTSRRAVSLFRSARLKALMPADYLARIEAPLQERLGRLAPSPSLYIASRNRGRAPVPGSVPGGRPDDPAVVS